MPSQKGHFAPQKQLFFFRQNGPGTESKRPKEGKWLLHTTCALTSLSQRALYCFLTPQYVRETAKNGPNCVQHLSRRPKTKNGPYLGLRGSKRMFRGHLVPPQPPTFCGFQASDSPNDTPRPPYHWSLGAAGGQPGPRTVGANGGSTGVPRAKKMIFSKVLPRPFGMLKQVFLARFEPVVTRFGPWKIPKCLKNGPYQDQK